ncbi:MAG TPA: glutamine-hydrolyzing GMP synthase [Bacteroidales bacterium]|nr:glutamine-hydrolyzing GMP synthase [Bacteroidales bacterium]HPZ61512.1 glutamine-hydrolyzing GMP synthase [Bacteroidales bacterium]HQD59152.1 glutamine-hydrolyzing GMP synthase [Bacteroidales bacterium]
MEKIIIINNGSQYTQLIARKLREFNVYCEILPWNQAIEVTNDIKGIILSGSQYSINDPNAPTPNLDDFIGKVPILAICFGAQYIAKYYGGEFIENLTSECGNAKLKYIDNSSPIFKNIYPPKIVFITHSDTIVKIPKHFKIICSTDNEEIAGFQISKNKIYGLLFHPEHPQTEISDDIFRNFLAVCKVSYDWTPNIFIEKKINEIKEIVGNDEVIIGLSGGVDSTVTAILIQKAIGNRLHGFFIDTGLLRKNEFEDVLNSYKKMGINVKGIDAKDIFLSRLKGIIDPEEKRKIIGMTFIEIFENEAKKIKNVRWLAQGTIYTDVIESGSVNGLSKTIKSHHNVGGLPDKLNLKLLEPIRMLFKDEVRKIGSVLCIPLDILNRHPFPGPGLAVRILGEVTYEKVKLLQDADDIYISMLKENNFYNKIWQAFAVLLPVKTVGISGDERSYDYAIAIRAINSIDGMTANAFDLPFDFLNKLANEITSKVNGVNRIVYDLSPKPPATIEWE